MSVGTDKKRANKLSKFSFEKIKLTMLKRVSNRHWSWFAFVMVLTTSLACDAIGRFGFVPMVFNSLTWIGFVVHELGHLALRIAPPWFTVAGGTFFQLALPAGAIIMFIRQRDDAAACFAVCWLAISLVHSADYIADARIQRLDMGMSANFWSMATQQSVRPDELSHDWEYLLSSVGMLEWDRLIATCVRSFAVLIAIGATLTNGALLYLRVAVMFVGRGPA